MRSRLVLVPLIAALALLAGAAPAGAALFHSEAENSELHGVNKTPFRFATSMFVVTCSTATYKGSQAGKTVEAIKVVPTVSNCTMNLLGIVYAASVNLTSCLFDWNAFKGTAHVICQKALDTVDIDSAGCNIRIGAQKVDDDLDFDVTLFAEEVDITQAYSNVHYTQSGACSTKTGTDGQLTSITSIGARNIVNKGKVKYWWG